MRASISGVGLSVGLLLLLIVPSLVVLKVVEVGFEPASSHPFQWSLGGYLSTIGLGLLRRCDDYQFWTYIYYAALGLFLLGAFGAGPKPAGPEEPVSVAPWFLALGSLSLAGYLAVVLWPRDPGTIAQAARLLSTGHPVRVAVQSIEFAVDLAALAASTYIVSVACRRLWEALKSGSIDSALPTIVFVGGALAFVWPCLLGQRACADLLQRLAAREGFSAGGEACGFASVATLALRGVILIPLAALLVATILAKLPSSFMQWFKQRFGIKVDAPALKE